MNKLGIIGNPLSHTLSPDIHNSAISFFNLDLVFEKWELEKVDLKKFFNDAFKKNIIGGCITIPHKENVLEFFNDYDESVDRIGAANWFKIEKSKIKGFNTDCEGFEKCIPNSLFKNISKKKCIIFGAGGSSKAVTEALYRNKVKDLTIVNRTPTKAKLISDKYKDIKIKIIDLNKINILKNEIENSDLIVNTTSVGMSSGPNPNGNLIEGYELKKNVTGIDLVYSPLVTPFLQSIKDSNGVIVNGIDMLIYQAQVGFEILTEKKCPFEIMKTALKLNWNVSIYNYMIILGEKYV